MTPHEQFGIKEAQLAADAEALRFRVGGLALAAQETEERRSIRRDFEDFMHGARTSFGAVFCVTTVLETERHNEFLAYSGLTETVTTKPTTREPLPKHVKISQVTNADHTALFIRKHIYDSKGNLHTVSYEAISRTDEKPMLYLG